MLIERGHEMFFGLHDSLLGGALRGVREGRKGAIVFIKDKCLNL